MVRLNTPRTGERGAVLVMTAFMMIGLLGVAALVVDIALVNQAQLRAQATVDAAVLAAAQDLEDIPTAIVSAKEYALRNYDITDADWASCTDPTPLPVPTAVSCISIDDADTPTHIRVRLPDRNVSAVFAQVIGHDLFAVSAAATAEVEYTTAGSPDGGTPDDDDAATPNLRDGDPGGGYPPCDTLPDWGQPAGVTKWTEFIFVFEHLDGTTTTICGTSRTTGGGNNAYIPNAGGNTINNPRGFSMHVSCSDIFTDGWTDPGRFDDTFGPHADIDPEWRVVRYTMDKYKGNKKDTGEPGFDKRCGETFTPITSEPPTTQPNIRLSD